MVINKAANLIISSTNENVYNKDSNLQKQPKIITRRQALLQKDDENINTPKNVVNDNEIEIIAEKPTLSYEIKEVDTFQPQIVDNENVGEAYINVIEPHHRKKLQKLSDFSTCLKANNISTHEDSDAVQKLIENNKIVWIQRKPIYVADGSKCTHPSFPTRDRSLFCYVCGNGGGELSSCEASGCPTKFHPECLPLHNNGGYTSNFMMRNGKTYCSRHHCAACFADRYRVRCFNGTFVHCSQCEMAWHDDPDCIPGGCTVNQKKEIICPGHVQLPDSPNLHTTHCADCQKKLDGGLLGSVKCTRCFRTVHFECLKRYFASVGIDLVDSDDYRMRAICNWCHSSDFVRYNQYAMGRLGGNKWYPCRVVSNDKYPHQDDPLLGAPGYVVVEWLPFRGKVLHNVLSHNRVIAMAANDYFFVTEAHKMTDIFDSLIYL